ncbi:MAG: hypothetical protein AcusKO_21840 [Acuticoccus sp.]
MPDTARRILVIDDSPQDQTYVEALLSPRSDVAVVRCASTGDEALAVLDNEPIDCVLLDYFLDGQSSMATLARIKAFDDCLPVVTLTGMGSETVVSDVLKCGATDYLNKMLLDEATLVATVDKAIATAAEARDRARRQNAMERSSRLEALSELAGGLMHDFNNLFTTLDYAIRLGLKTTTTPQARHHLTNALSVLDRGSELTQRLGTFAMRHAVLASARRVGDVLRDFEDLVRPTLGTRIGITCTAEDPDALLHCDQSQLELALINLALNAREAFQRAGKGAAIAVRVSAPPPGEDGALPPWLDLVVSDDGPGMTDDVRERAADPYFTTKVRGTGTGLGLAMVFGFVQQHGGEFEITAEPGGGTAVRMRLPSTGRAVKPVRNRRPAERTPTPDRAPSVPRRRRLLLVDDEVLLLLEAAEIIRDFGYDVCEASSGAEALAMIDPDNPVDLLLTDVQMPGMNGFELANAARAILPDLKVLYFSGYTGYSDADMGAVIAPVISKPCIPQELVDPVRALLDADARQVIPTGACAHDAARPRDRRQERPQPTPLTAPRHRRNHPRPPIGLAASPVLYCRHDGIAVAATARCTRAPRTPPSARGGGAAMSVPLTLDMTSADSPDRLAEVVGAFVADNHLPERCTFLLDLVLEEIVTNVINHGAGERAANISVRVRHDGNRLDGTVRDDAAPFDPLSRAAVDVDAGIDERAIGGLGIHLVREMTHDLTYRREGGHNVLSFSIELDKETP